ncbi:butyrophilin subfamily 3 member A2-like isoform X2 [Pelodiscus sinensis]|uniref:butyrophilin subfamily 3 member A2-like isoform X2 n=1 Tax=Pelodiscus sinensis TaxID=13735 RepID=UPI003F6C98A6
MGGGQLFQIDQVSGKMKVPSIGHSARASSPLPGFLVFFLTCYVRSRESAQFKVVGPDQPVTAVVGEEIVLPCHLAPRMSVENMEVTWFRSELSPFVHHYSDGKNQYEQQMPEYQGRTELLNDGLTQGNVTLKIFNVTVSDEGRYSCFVQDGTFYEETLLELKVAASGSAPHVSVENYQDGGIRVVCRSAGWYPEPEVTWRDLNGQAFPSVSQTNSQEANGLYETQNSAVIMENSNRNLSCLVRNTRLSQEKESTLFYISDPFFPKVNPWMVSLGVTLVVLLGSFALSVYLFRIKGKLTGEVGKLTGEVEKHLSTIGPQNGFLKDPFHDFSRNRGELHTELAWRRNIVCPGPGSAEPPLLEANVTLDPDTAHPQLILSEDGKRVRWEQTWQLMPNNPERFNSHRCVLGREGFTAGGHYWEVEVGDGNYWAVGVARESVSRKGAINLGPQAGIWAVERNWDKFQALTVPCIPLPLSHPSRIRVCLDCDGGQVTFIDAGTEAPIFTFPPGSLPAERIRPWIRVSDIKTLQLFP